MNSRKSQTFVGRPAEPGVYYILIKYYGYRHKSGHPAEYGFIERSVSGALCGVEDSHQPV